MTSDDCTKQHAELDQHVQRLATNVAVLDEKISAAFKRIDEERARTETLQKTVTALEVLTTEVKRIGEEQARQWTILNEEQIRQWTSIDTLRMKPAARWESVIGQIVALLVAAGVGILLSKL